MNLSPKFILALIFVFLINAFNEAFAAQVAAVKGNQVLVQGDNLEINGLYYVVLQGKRQGIIRIKQVKGKKGLAVLLKGKVNKGYNLVYRPKKAKSSTTAQTKTSPKSSSSSSKNYDKYSEPSKASFDNKAGYKSSSSSNGFYGIGGMLAYQMNSASVEFSNGDSDSLSGSSIGIKGFGDYQFSENIHLRGEFGTFAFQSEGTDKCFGAVCIMNINYLGATAFARYLFGSSSSKTRFWGGAGLSIFFPMSTGNTNAVNVDDVGSSLVFNAGAGLDYRLNDKYYIPVQVEYSLFPPSDQVSANSILVKAGLGMRL